MAVTRSVAVMILVGLTALVVVAQQRPPASVASTSQAVVATTAFLNTLDERQQAKVRLPLNATTRTVWSNLPTGAPMQVGATERNGLKFGDMTASQQEAALATVSAVLSRAGYQKVLNILHGDERLDETTPTRSSPQIRFGRAEFYLAILGTPSIHERWMLQFGGHHLAINVTMAGGNSVLTPTHTGAQPATYALNGETIRPLGRENDKAFALMNALDAAQQKQAVLDYQVRNLVLGPGEDGKVIQPEGIRASALNARQRAMLLDLIGEWVTIVSDAPAAAKMKEVEANLGQTYFAWAGATTNGKEAYFRIQGPTVLIEYAPQGPTGTPTVNHIHTIYRDPTNDYGVRLAAR
jgi:hypothetical protein